MAEDYSQFNEQPKDERFATLSQLVAATKAKEHELLELAAKLQIAQEELRELTWVKIPKLMDDIGLAEFKDTNGQVVSIKEEIDAGIKQELREVAHKWLDENGHAGLLKRDVIVSFNKGQEEAAAKLLTELSTKFAAVTQNKKVHPSTLKAWVKEMLANGKDIPQETFGVFRRRVAQIHAAKKK